MWERYPPPLPIMNKYDEKYNESIKNQYERLKKLPTPNWPTLAGRLANPIVTLKQAREQLKKSRSYIGK